MEKIEITEDYVLTGSKIIALRIRKLNFAEFARLATAALASVTDDVTYDVAFMRLRLKNQVTLLNEVGADVTLSDLTVMTMPRRVGGLARKNLMTTDMPQGEIISDGDGILSPITYKFGTPIALTKTSNGVKEEGSITEVEFMAPTYGDIEHVLGASNSLMQVVELIKRCAKPVGMLTMPSWAVDAVNLSDGNAIAEKILSRFLE